MLGSDHDAAAVGCYRFHAIHSFVDFSGGRSPAPPTASLEHNVASELLLVIVLDFQTFAVKDPMHEQAQP